jgi:hypothetical protein
MHPSQERRSTPRYLPVVEKARVGWWEGGQFRSEPARLHNIGHGGAALRFDEDVLCTTSVWMCVVGNSPTEWVPANLASSFDATAEGDARQLRIQFTDGCPYEVFKQVWGQSASVPAEPAGRAQPAPDPSLATPLAFQPGPAIDPSTNLESYRVTTSGAVPTLPAAERSVRAKKDRLAFVPYAMMFVLSATIVVLLLILIYQRLGELSVIEWLLRGPPSTR